jgi:hypothetical protein
VLRFTRQMYSVQCAETCEDVYVYMHSNKLVVIGITDAHPAAQSDKRHVTKVDFDTGKKLSNSQVSGKKKKGAEALQAQDILCELEVGRLVVFAFWYFVLFHASSESVENKESSGARISSFESRIAYFSNFKIWRFTSQYSINATILHEVAMSIDQLVKNTGKSLRLLPAIVLSDMKKPNTAMYDNAQHVHSVLMARSTLFVLLFRVNLLN